MESEDRMGTLGLVPGRSPIPQVLPSLWALSNQRTFEQGDYRKHGTHVLPEDVQTQSHC